jgi:UPF0755 protein
MLLNVKNRGHEIIDSLTTHIRHLVIGVAGLLFLVLVVLMTFILSSSVPGSEQDIYVVHIERGMSFRQTVERLQEEGALGSSGAFEVLARTSGMHSRIKAGVYEFRGETSIPDLLHALTSGSVQQRMVTVREGLTTRQIASIMRREVGVDSLDFIDATRDPQILRDLGVNALSLEGFLFPETYKFFWGISAASVVRTMVQEFERNFPDSLQVRIGMLGLNLIEVMTLASIIEGEASWDSERRTISAVYHNRLKRGMRLQADPTIQYVISDGPRRLLYNDLEIDSPYNTYRNAGLPPGPINNPGTASIMAALYPADVSYLYFVANGDGSHTFSRTLGEHNKAKARFDRYRSMIRQQQGKR